MTEKFQFWKRSTINLQCNFFLLFKKYTINCANFWLPFIFTGLKWMEWVGPLQLKSHLVQRGTKRLWVELRKFSTAKLCKLSDSSLNIYGVVKMWYLFLFSFFYFYIYIFFRFFLHSVAFSWFIRALPVYAWFNFTCNHPPWATPGTSPALRARGWGGSVPGVGGCSEVLYQGGAFWRVFLFVFKFILHVLATLWHPLSFSQ